MESRNEQRLSDAQRATIAEHLARDNRAHASAIAPVVRPRNTIYTRYVKRLFDIVISAFALVITSPINLVLAIATFFDVGRPLLFHQTRTGKNGRPFRITKFRNMTNETDANGVLLPPKERITRWGRFVRKTSLDELLNFWSIFKGDMSLIGPRPLIEKYLPRYSDRHMMRHAVRPGLECPILDESIKELSGWNQRLENDVWYVEHVSFAVDVKMVAALVRMVFDRKQTKSRSLAQRGSFMGYNKDGRAIDQTEIPLEYLALIQQEREDAANAAVNPVASSTASGAATAASDADADAGAVAIRHANSAGASNAPRTAHPATNAQSKKRIALFIRGFHHGGIEKVFESYFTHMDLSPFEIHVITHLENDPARMEIFCSMGCIIHELSPVHGHKLTKHNLEECRALFKNNTFDVVHNNMPENLLPLHFAKKAGVPVRILHAHSNYRANLKDKNPLKQKVFAAGFALNAAQATHLIAVSRVAAESAFGVKRAQQAFLLPNAIDVRHFAFNKEMREKMRSELGINNRVCLGHVGRYENDAKNQEFVLHVFRDYLAVNPQAHLLMIGDGPLRGQYEELAHDLDIKGQVTFTGALKNVADYLQAMDVFLLPSRKEGFGIVALEAQACGLPCLVSTQVPQEVAVTSLVRFLDIDQGTEEWVNALTSLFDRAPAPDPSSAAEPSSNPATEQTTSPAPSPAFPGQNKGNRLEFNQQVLQAGYDITQNASLLSNLYRKGQFTA